MLLPRLSAASVFTALCVAACSAADISPLPAGGYAARADVQAYMTSLVQEHGFHPQELSALLGRAERRESILEAIARPAEKRLEWHQYRRIFLTEQRIEQGLAFWNAHAATLRRAEQQYAVAPEYITAIIGVETLYGQRMGSHRVLDALVTLGFDYPPRADFFRSELTHFLLLVREEGMNPLELRGSYAGAMGYGQFISSSMRAYAVDFDGDGQRNLLGDPVDAIGSVANYFRAHGWRGDAHLAVPLPAAQAERLDALVGPALELNSSVGELKSAGLRLPAGLPLTMRARVMRVIGDAGPEYRLVLNDFYAITRYNHSDLYALAVHELARAIRDRRHAETS